MDKQKSLLDELKEHFKVVARHYEIDAYNELLKKGMIDESVAYMHKVSMSHVKKVYGQLPN